ncbi:MAG: DUF3347 domain-containing protein [Chitinophagaceae bacterium]
MKALFVILNLLVLNTKTFSQDVNKLFYQYHEIKNALIDADSKQVAELTSSLQQWIKNDVAYNQKTDLQKSVEKLVKVNGIEKQRESFNDFSIIIWNIVKVSTNIHQPVYYQYCSMKKAYWLSNEKEIKNPYYGASMLNCGKVVEVKQ